VGAPNSRARLGRQLARARTALAGRARRTADRLDGRASLVLDYPTSAENHPRYGYGRPTHPELAELVRRNDDAYQETLEAILARRESLRQIPSSPSDVREPAWRNPYLPALDGAALYTFLCERKPAHYVEIGSGNSTRFVARAKRDCGLETEIVSIDPHPRAEMEALCDTAIRAPLESVDLAVFDRIEPGDIVFMDGSHRVFMNSDAVVFFLDVLYRLPPGVLVAVHDIYLPDDYDPWEADDFYSEQYLLALALLADPGKLRIVLPADYVEKHSRLRRVLEPLWNEPALAGADHYGCAFWIETPAD
jgi:predicted O-methyltransferase YrrM